MVDTFYQLGRVAGFPMRPLQKESRYRLPVWGDRRRPLHLTDVR
jgi:hypothetical protein